MKPDNSIPNINNKQIYLQFLKEDRHENSKAYFHSMHHVFKDIELKNKRVVDVGSGKGLMTIYAALCGAREVISLEPELHGSSSKVLEIQKKRIKTLGLNNVNILAQDFNDWSYGGDPVDIVLSFASINHLFESPHHALYHTETLQKYLDIARKIRNMLSSNGVAVITDACRYGLFYWLKEIGINRPWRPKEKTTINYRIHQNPNTWQKIFKDAGFSKVKIKYPLPYKLRKFQGLVENPITNFLLEAEFILHCYV